jgi:hypothetical protein
LRHNDCRVLDVCFTPSQISAEDRVEGSVTGGLLLRLFRKVQKLHPVEGPLLLSREDDKVFGHRFDPFIVRADLANRAIHTNKWRGDSRQDSDTVSDLKIMHAMDS